MSNLSTSTLKPIGFIAVWNQLDDDCWVGCWDAHNGPPPLQPGDQVLYQGESLSEAEAAAGESHNR